MKKTKYKVGDIVLVKARAGPAIPNVHVKLIEKYVIEYNQWLDSRELRPSIISIKKEIKNLMSDAENLENNNREIQEIYDKFSDRLVKKIISVSENGKNTDALKIINKIFTND